MSVFVHKFYTTKYHQTGFYATIEGEKIYFNEKVINVLYDLLNDAQYPRNELINNPSKYLKTFTWPSLEWEITPT